jgi:hypothetical protein
VKLSLLVGRASKSWGKRTKLPSRTCVLAVVPARPRSGSMILELRCHDPGLHLNIELLGDLQDKTVAQRDRALRAAGYTCWQNLASRHAYRRWLRLGPELETELRLIHNRPRDWFRLLERAGQPESLSTLRKKPREILETLKVAASVPVPWNVASLGFGEHFVVGPARSAFTIGAFVNLDWKLSVPEPEAVLSLTASTTTRFPKSQRESIENSLSEQGLVGEGSPSFVLGWQKNRQIADAFSKAASFLSRWRKIADRNS